MSFVDRLNTMVRLSPRMVSWIKELQERIWCRYEDDHKIVAFCGCGLCDWLSKMGLNVTPHVLLLIPNLISLLRLLIVPIFLMGWVLSVSQLFYSTVYLLLMLLDLLDGPVARQCGLGSTLGKALDPLADKVAHSSILLVAVLFNLVPVWLFFMLLAKEVVLLIISPHYQATGARWWGKIGTLTEAMVLLGAFLFFLPNWVFVVFAISQVLILIIYLIDIN